MNAPFGFNVHPDLSMSQRVAMAGIKTHDVGIYAFLTKGGVSIRRPHVENAPAVCFAVFNVTI